jgi:[ribosomal protein S18]-alanine N-acetyltransferase
MADPWRMAERTVATGATIRLAPLRAADVPEIMAIEKACFSDPWSERAFQNTLDSPHTRSLVAVDSGTGEAVGYVVAWLVVDEAEVANIAVAPAWRGQGIGGLLLDEVIDRARERGVNVVYLEVRESNGAALRLYGSRGFEQVGRRVAYYRRPREDALVLRRILVAAEEGTGS